MKHIPFATQFGGIMEPVTLIASALAVGAAAGVQDTTSQGVRSASSRLWQMIRDRLGGRSAELDSAVAAQSTRDESEPDPVAPGLRQLLTSIGADQDQQLRSLASQVLRQPDRAQSTFINGSMTISNSNGIQIGDQTHQENIYNANR
ncbi:hypothetical protein ACFYXJ_04150 [Streptomyces sp. NPDC002667]|uniref:hypothetical protein n=1 Tax=Streptomyces sp. NPDC002667 TaxID=3364657 RepID=UPI0036B3BA40